MNAWDRVRTVLSGKVPDAVPRALYDVAIDHYNDSTLALFREHRGCHPRDCFRQDLRGIRCPAPSEADPAAAGVLRDMNTVDQCRAAMARWRPPPPDRAALRQRVEACHAAGYPAVVVGSISDFETPFSLRGREQFFCDLAEEPEWLPFFLDALADAVADQARAAASAGADLFGIGDDLGSQRGLLIRPALWRRLFKPRLKRIVEASKPDGGATSFFLHTDGQVGELIPDFLEIGVDILNPVQPEVLDPADVKRRYGRDLIFFGAISVQHTLPFGTPDEVAAEVRLRMETIGAGGGYLMTPSHLLNADIPWDNIEAFFKAADQFGRYI